MDGNGSRNNWPLKVEDCDDYNPWIADDASAFLKYNCPECDFSNKTLQLFTEHALENHIKSKVFFTPENLAEQFKLDIIKNEDPEYFEYENDFDVDHFFPPNNSQSNIKSEVFDTKLDAFRS